MDGYSSEERSEQATKRVNIKGNSLPESSLQKSTLHGQAANLPNKNSTQNAEDKLYVTESFGEKKDGEAGTGEVADMK